MKEVIRIDQPGVNDRPVEFTHHISTLTSQISNSLNTPSDFDKIIYLGQNSEEEDLFAAYGFGQATPAIYKGHLNSGRY